MFIYYLNFYKKGYLKLWPSGNVQSNCSVSNIKINYYEQFISQESLSDRELTKMVTHDASEQELVDEARHGNVVV